MASVAPISTTPILPTLNIQDLTLHDDAPKYQTKTTTANLVTLLSNSIVASNVLPHLPLTSFLDLGKSSRALHDILSDHYSSMRYLDMSPMKKLILQSSGPVDSGGNNWRAERMDEALTEDDFYGGPIRGVFFTLHRKEWLHYVSTMILDGLTVTAEVVREIIAEDKFNVRILSIRDCKQLNYRKLSDVLKYSVRPSRPAGMPKLRGLYLFGPKEPVPVKEEPLIGRRRSPTRYAESRPSHTVSAVAVHLGPEWESKTQAALVAERHEFDDDKWYHSAGKIITRPVISAWAETLQACEGIIHFDAVLCRGPRHNLPEPGADTSKYLPPAVATIALGPDGCQKCHTAPEGPGIFGESPSHELPLLAPPPLISTTVRAAQMPSSTIKYTVPKLIARCKDCLKHRWCERCHKWWCESCYEPGTSDLHETDLVDNASEDGEMEQTKMGAERQCFGCGQTCVSCKDLFMRNCKTCNNEYCVVDNDGSSPSRCDWCNYSGRRTRQLF